MQIENSIHRYFQIILPIKESGFQFNLTATKIPINLGFVKPDLKPSDY